MQRRRKEVLSIRPGSALSRPGIVEALLDALVVVPDTRKARGKRHSLLEVLTIAVVGCMCGCDSAEALEDWGGKEHEWLSRFLKLPHGTPSQDVYLRVFAAIDPSKFRQAFLSWMAVVFENLGIDQQIAVDGQTHRGSGSRADNRGGIHVVHALACGAGLVLGQTKTSEKSNEITAIPEVLSLLDLGGALVSIDAMGCQVAIAKLIKDKGGDYLLGLKGNQSTLSEETAMAFDAAQAPAHHNVDEAQPPVVVSFTDTDKGHGRIERRTTYVMRHFGAWVPSAARWPALTSLIAVVSERTDVLSGKTATETRHYISSQSLTAEAANEAVRKHWEVETRLHWCLDVTFGQDANQTRTAHAAENFGIVRHFALNLLRQYSGDKFSMPRRRRLCDYRKEYRAKLLGLAPEPSV